MKETPADRARDKKRGIKEGSAQDTKIDARPGNRAPTQRAQTAPPPQQGAANTPPASHMPADTSMPRFVPHAPAQAPNTHSGGADPVHAAMATSIAHAILGHRSTGGQY